jgi:hypothetical protein
MKLNKLSFGAVRSSDNKAMTGAAGRLGAYNKETIHDKPIKTTFQKKFDL